MSHGSQETHVEAELLRPLTDSQQNAGEASEQRMEGRTKPQEAQSSDCSYSQQLVTSQETQAQNCSAKLLQVPEPMEATT